MFGLIMEILVGVTLIIVFVLAVVMFVDHNARREKVASRLIRIEAEHGPVYIQAMSVKSIYMGSAGPVVAAGNMYYVIPGANSPDEVYEAIFGDEHVPNIKEEK